MPDAKPRKRGFTPGVTKAMKLEAKKRALEYAYRHLQDRIKKVGKKAVSEADAAH